MYTFYSEATSAKVSSVKKACESHVRLCWAHERVGWIGTLTAGDLKTSVDDHAPPAIFTILSKLNCGSPALSLLGPSSGNGFGIGNVIKEGGISIQDGVRSLLPMSGSRCASMRHLQACRILDTLQDTCMMTNGYYSSSCSDQHPASPLNIWGLKDGKAYQWGRYFF